MSLDVLIIGGSFPMPMAGGSINYVYNVLKGLEGLSCAILTAKGDIEINNKFDSSYSFRIIRSRFIYHVLETNRGSIILRIFNLIMSIFQAVIYIVKLKPKIVYFTEFSPLTSSALLAACICNFKLGIFTYSEELQMYERCILYRTLMRKIFHKSDVIITVCEYAKKIINHFGEYNHKIYKIIPPVWIIKNLHRNNCHEMTTKIRLLTVARLEERKGHVDVIEAITKLYSRYPNIEYNIVGIGGYEKNISSAIAKYNAEEYVHMLGKLSDVDLQNIYMNSHIFVMPHKELENGDTEGCPTVFLEASYYRLPVIGGNAGGVSDAILHGKTGYIIHSKEELYRYLEALIESIKLRDELGNNGYNYASQFLAENQAKKFREVTNHYL